MNRWDRKYIQGIRDKLNKGKQGSNSPVVVTLLTIIENLDKQLAAMVALLERVVKQFPVPDHSDSPQHRFEQGELIGEILLLLKEAKEVEHGKD